jgi:hypothetical protein
MPHPQMSGLHQVPGVLPFEIGALALQSIKYVDI